MYLRRRIIQTLRDWRECRFDSLAYYLEMCPDFLLGVTLSIKKLPHCRDFIIETLFKSPSTKFTKFAEGVDQFA